MAGPPARRKENVCPAPIVGRTEPTTPQGNGKSSTLAFGARTQLQQAHDVHRHVRQALDVLECFGREFFLYYYWHFFFSATRQQHRTRRLIYLLPIDVGYEYIGHGNAHTDTHTLCLPSLALSTHTNTLAYFHRGEKKGGLRTVIPACRPTNQTNTHALLHQQKVLLTPSGHPESSRWIFSSLEKLPDTRTRIPCHHQRHSILTPGARFGAPQPRVVAAPPDDILSTHGCFHLDLNAGGILHASFPPGLRATTNKNEIKSEEHT